MLHYYFNSREQLLDAMIEERFLPLRERIGAIFADNRDSPVDALTEMVRVLAELAEKYRWFAPLWMQEVIGEMPVLRTHLQARFGDEKYHTTLATIKGWQQEGKAESGAGPRTAVHYAAEPRCWCRSPACAMTRGLAPSRRRSWCATC